jgi:putative hemolysin
MRNGDVTPFKLNGQLAFLPGGRFRPVIEATIEKVFGLERLNTLYKQLPATATTDQFLNEALNCLSIEYHVTQDELAHVPRSGPLLVVANHPFGALEGLILAAMLRRVRPDVRFLANFMLERVRELRELFICVDPFGGTRAARRNLTGVRAAHKWLTDGGCLVVFPAGEVSHLHLRNRAITDPTWNTAAARLAMATAANVLPVYFDGNNSALFQLAGLLRPRLRTAMLPRELINKAKTTISLRIGTPVDADRLRRCEDARSATDYLRFRTYLLAPAQDDLWWRRHGLSNRLRGAAKSSRKTTPVADPLAPALLCEEVSQLPAAQCLARNEKLSVWYATAEQVPNILLEIGRLRELTFRAAGEGTGHRRDIDLYDAYYEHLFVWSDISQELVGAYRMARSDTVRRRYGLRGLYTYSLFKYDEKFLDQLGPSVELGRSFVRQEYQRSYSALLMLWKGIGRRLIAYGGYRTLFGPVSLSADLGIEFQSMIVDCVTRHHFAAELASQVRPRRPLRNLGRSGSASLGASVPRCVDLDELGELFAQRNSTAKTPPVLLRQYLKLGGRVAAFHLDTAFNRCVDGLIAVDLTRAPATTLRRIMGKDTAERFLADAAAASPDTRLTG